MIRNPLQSAVGRSRPDLNRVVDGIAASLRQFSISARRSAADDDNEIRPRPSARQRGAAAVNEISALNGSSSKQRTPAASSASRPGINTSSSSKNPPPAARAQGPNTVTVRSLLDTFGGGGGGSGDGGGGGTSSTGWSNEITSSPQQRNIVRGGGSGGGTSSTGFSNEISSSPQQRNIIRGGGGSGGDTSSTSFSNEISSSPQQRNIIRGGFRGRGRGQGGNFSPSSRGPSSQGGGSFNRDDRPRRARGGGGAGGGASGGRRRRRDDGDGESGGGGRGKQRDRDERFAKESLDSPAKVKAYIEQQEIGLARPFNPTAVTTTEGLWKSLAGYGPAVATSGTPFAQGETALRQARVLGGGGFFHQQHVAHPDAVRAAWRDGTGVFVPPSDEARQWTETVLERMVERSGEGSKPFGAPEEVKTAVLEDALLGRYEGPKYAEPGDAAGTIRSYVKRDGTWNAEASRRIEAKVKSLLPQRRPAAGAAAAAVGAAAAKPAAKA
ncbi:succinate semialdehyde dehydrogenase NADP+ linked [Hypoxylon texense]